MESKGFPHLGVWHGQLTPCPSTPNCVCTNSEDVRHQIEPLTWSGTAADAIAAIRRLLEQMPRVRLITQTDRYLHAEFATAVFRFIDDVEFYVDETAGVVHFRSASRVGYSDLGVNRRRMEGIRERFQQIAAK